MKHKDLMLKIFKILLFLSIVGFIFTQLTYVYRGTLAHTRANLTGWYDEKKDSLDVVILGTSCTFSAIMPMEMWGDYGIAAYDMCTNQLFQDSMKYYVREIKKTQSPKLLIVDTAPFLYSTKSSVFAGNEGWLRYNTDGLSLSLNRINLINDVIPKGNRIEYYFDLFYYRGNKNVNWNYMFNKYPNARKGYNNLPQRVSFEEDDYVINQEALELPEEDNGYFISLLEELKDFKGDILFIEQPLFYTKDFYEQSSYSEYMENMVKEYGYDYLDMSKVREDIGLDSQFDFSLDFFHFTTYSAEKITNYLAQYISDTYELDDHREDPEYQKWQEQYKEWLDIKSSEKEANDNQILERFKEADLEQYISFLKSEYYSSCIYIPASSSALNNEKIEELLRKNGADLDDAIDDDVFILNDHSINKTIEVAGNNTLDFNSAFGHILYDNRNGSPSLYINGSENNYLEENNDMIHVILVKKETGEIVDDTCFIYTDNMWVRDESYIGSLGVEDELPVED
jgi:hypothetical protein